MLSQTQFGTGLMRKNSILKAAVIAAFAALFCIGCGDNGVTPPVEYTLNIDINPLKGGSVDCNPSKMAYKVGDIVTVTATADTGYRFVRWTGVLTSTDTTITITINNANLQLTANFEQIVTPPSGNTFTDSRDQKVYKKTIIGSQTWMAENLNYDVPNNREDVCYSSNIPLCEQYGRMYTWTTAMNGESSSSTNPSGVRGICPVGWHLPSYAEWTVLTDYVGSNAGTKLKSSQYWKSYGNVPTGTDRYGFSALPGGSEEFFLMGERGQWWSATDDPDLNACCAEVLTMYYNSEDAGIGQYQYDKKFLFSVRCVAD